ncbi:MAG: DM13 domain-containing protein [Candidatus Staskawiczbacteria bacterium]|nr:DM13 domain-containing protein [Candidatus Staskawiczbacteria bacterium]
MKKNLLIGFIVVCAIVVVGYVIFTLKSGKILDDVSPLNKTESLPTSTVIKDNLDTMGEAEKNEFMQEVESMKNDIMEKSDAMPSQATLIAKGDFMKRFHGVEGRALLIKDGNKKTVRFEDFQTDNGPQLRIYLSTSLDAKDFVDLGTIKATRGNVNYDIPPETDTTKYKYVLVWCKPFSVLFSYANLISI